jgi:hypothetical protein
MNTVVWSLFLSALLSGLGMWLWWWGNELYRTRVTPVIAASTSEFATTQQDADEQCARTPGCVWFNTFFPTHQEAVVQQRLTLYAHIDSFLLQYEQYDCQDTFKQCISLLQEWLFAVSDYWKLDWWNWFISSREQRKHTAKPFWSDLSKLTLEQFHSPFDRLIEQWTWLTSPSFVAIVSYQHDIVHLLRGFQYQIKWSLLTLDQTGKLVPWNSTHK